MNLTALVLTSSLMIIARLVVFGGDRGEAYYRASAAREAVRQRRPAEVAGAATVAGP
jgi:hypothetical protein